MIQLATITKLIKIEYLKYRSNTVVIILLGLFTFSMPLLIFLGKKVFKHAGPPLPSAASFYEFPTVWDYQGYVGNWCVSIILGFLVIYMHTTEISNRTYRQSVLNGLLRKEIFTSKLLIITVLSLSATLLYYLSSITIGLIHTDLYDLELIFDNNWAGLRYFLMCVGYLSLATVISTILRSSALSMMVYMGYILMVEMIIRLIVIFYYKVRFPNFAPGNAIEDLMPNPLMKIPDFFAKNEFSFSFLLNYYEAIIASIVYIGIFIFGMRRNILKKDM